MMSIDFHSRRKWFDDYMRRAGSGEIELPARGHRYTCPCCGYPTIEEKRASWEICSLCNWEDDGQDDPDADKVAGGPNYSYSLSEARENFEKYLIKFNPDRPATSMGGNENSPVQMRAKSEIVEAFNNMVNETDEAALAALWQTVYDNEWTLEQEVYRIVRNYEARMKGK